MPNVKLKAPLTVQEFDSLLEAYKGQNPKKYAIKEANGEFAAFRAKLSGAPVMEEPVKEEPKEEPKEEAPKEELKKEPKEEEPKEKPKGRKKLK